MKNKGFTLVEMLAVIVILAILITIAVPASIKISAKIKTNMYCKKVDLILDAAGLYGQDNYDSINRITGTKVSIKTLVEGNYLKRDDVDIEKGDGTKVMIVDPRDNSGMDDDTVTLNIKNNRVVTKYDAADYNNYCKK